MPRFSGKTGKRNLLTTIHSQRTVAGNKELAKKLISAGTLIEYLPEEVIITQGHIDNDMFMIISGSVSILINKREVAVRSSGNHFGELALLDSTARRSATILAKEKTLVLKLPELEITKIAKSYPEFWRRIAVEIGGRLRERTKFIEEPNSIPNVFIGSSGEALNEASYINTSLSRRNIICKLWTQGVFDLSQTTIEDLIKASVDCDFAVLFLTPDDLTASRGRKKASPRDNVIFELGLFMGAIGRDRTYIVKQRGVDLKLPTDLLGVTCATYEGGAKSIGMRLRTVSKVLRDKIHTLGPK